MFVHETAIIDDGAHIGEGTKIWHWVHVCAGAHIGARCILGQNVYVAGSVRVGDGVKMQNNVSLYDGVVIEDDVFLGPSMVFTNVVNPRAFVSRKDEFKSTLVGRGATIGANATILCGVTLGKYAFIGAGSVVTRDVPNYALVAGNPARWLRWVCRCGEGLEAEKEPMECARCGAHYTLQEGNLIETFEPG